MKTELSRLDKKILSYYTDRDKYVPNSVRNIAKSVGCSSAYVQKIKRELVLRGILDKNSFMPIKQRNK